MQLAGSDPRGVRYPGNSLEGGTGITLGRRQRPAVQGLDRGIRRRKHFHQQAKLVSGLHIDCGNRQGRIGAVQFAVTVIIPVQGIVPGRCGRAGGGCLKGKIHTTSASGGKAVEVETAAARCHYALLVRLQDGQPRIAE